MPPLRPLQSLAIQHPDPGCAASRWDGFVDPYFRRAKADSVVTILKARDPARIMTAIGDSQTNGSHLQIANRWVVPVEGPLQTWRISCSGIPIDEMSPASLRKPVGSAKATF
jgi:hypothetical protein